MVSLNPVQIFQEGAQEDKGETARLSSFVGAIAIGDLIKTTLGPKGMDKVMVPSSPHATGIQVTNDGATILKSIGVDNPAAKVLVDISLVQDDEVGDGTTSVTVLACELLKEAEQLVSAKIHPQTIIAGWRLATDSARAALTSIARDNSGDPEKFKEDLLNIARTTLSSKILTQHKEFFARLAVEAVARLKGSGNLEAIQIIKKLGGSLADSYLEEGFLLEKKVGVNQPKRLENARILIANTAMDTDKIKFLAFHDERTWKMYNESCYDLNLHGTSSAHLIPDHAHNNSTNDTCRTLFCDHHHLFTDYILFDVLLLTVYLYGVYLFHSDDAGDLSYLHNLASRAFVMNSMSSQVSSDSSRGSNWRLLLSIMSFCVAGAVWLFFSLVIRILTIFSAHLMNHSVAIEWHTEIFYGGEKIVLVMFSLVGFMFFDMVYMATVMNHVVQSELLVWLLSSVTTLIRHNQYHNSDAAIKDILECRRYLRTLNGRAATAVALVLFIVGNMAILAALTLNKMAGDTDKDDAFKITVAIFNIITWFTLVSLPVIQATLFGVPMTPALVYGGVAVSTFIVILLSQTDIYVLSSL